MIDEARFEALNAAVLEILRRQREMDQRLRLVEAAVRDGSPLTEAATNREHAQEVSPDLSDGSDPQAAATATRDRSTGAIADRLQDLSQTKQLAEAPIETRVGLTLVNRIGVLTLILGVAFFFKWAVDNNWIGPAARVLLGLCAGFAALAVAEFLWRKSQQIFAQGITGAGIAIVYLSAYAAYGFYHLVPSSVAFAFMASVTLLAYALALRYNSVALAAFGLFGGYATPILLSDGHEHAWFLVFYLLLLNAGAMRLQKQRLWRTLELLALVATNVIFFGLLSPGLARHASPASTVGALAFYTLFAYAGSEITFTASQVLAALEVLTIWSESSAVFFVLEVYLLVAGLFQSVRRRVAYGLNLTFASFWLCAFVCQLQLPRSTGAQFAGITAGYLAFLSFTAAVNFGVDYAMTSGLSLAVVAANGLVYFGLAYLLLQPAYHAWLGLLAISVAASYLGLAWLLRRRNAERTAEQERTLLLALGMAVTFITLAIPIQLTSFHITIAWAIQGAVLCWISTRLQSVRVAMAGASILALVVARLVIFDSTLYWNEQGARLFLNGRFLTFAVAAVCAFAAAHWGKTLHPRLALGEYLGAHAVLLMGLTVEVLEWARRMSSADAVLSVETIAVSLLFAVYALCLVSLGVATRTAIDRIAGLALVGFVIVKLYLFDVWQLDRVYRIAAFVALGLLLISTSFLYSRFRPIIESLLRKDGTPS